MMVKPCDQDQNQKTQDTTKYKGVRKRKWGKWVSEIRLPNSRQRIWLGSYDSAQKAARAFDAAMFCLRGRNATFNFPDNPPDIAGGRSMTPSQIQAAAAEFANGGAHEGCSGGAEGPSRDASVVETHKGSLTDVLTPVGSGNYGSEYGIFRGFDDLGGEFYVPEMANVSYGEDNGEGLIVDESFLWNF